MTNRLTIPKNRRESVQKRLEKNALVSFKDHVLVGSAFQAEYSIKFVGQSTPEKSSGHYRKAVGKIALVLFKDHAAVRRQSFGNCIKPFQ